MGIARKTITITDQQEAWIKAQVRAEAFTNDSEYIRDLIRRDQARSTELEVLRAELIRGELSGPARPFNSTAFKRRMATKHAGKKAR